MATYNFAKSQKNNLDDTHTEMRLKDQHGEAPEVVTEKQLEKKDREGDKDVTTEKQLEKVRTGGAEVVLEKNLNDSKGMFGSKFRNPKTYEGDINKLEEKRLSGKKTEDEKYSASSETPKQVKWWDGLKKAKSDSVVKTAQSLEDEVANEGELDFDRARGYREFDPASRFQRLKETPGLNPDEEGILPDGDIVPDINDLSEITPDEEGTAGDIPKKMYVSKNKEGSAPLPHIYMEFSFDPDAFENDAEAKSSALDKAIELRPNLVDKITIDDFSDPKVGNIDSTIQLRLIGEEYLAPIEVEEEENSIFVSVENENVDVGGTPMTVGRVVLGPQAEAMDDGDLLQGIVDYIADKTGIEIPTSSVQINMSKLEATFAVSQEEKEGVINETVTTDAQDIPEEMLANEEEEDLGEDLEEDLEEDLGEDASQIITKPENVINVPEPKLPLSNAKSIYDFPIVIADLKKK